MKLKSHDDKLLIDHLQEVADNCVDLIKERALFSTRIELKQILQDIAFLAGAFHDLGKGTRYFQHYLLSENHEEIGPKSHALISAIFVKEVIRIYLSKTTLSGLEKLLFTHLSFVAVKRHHGRLDNFEDEIYKTADKNKELQKQIIVFEEPEINEIISHFCVKINIEYSFDSFKNHIQSGDYSSEMNEFIIDFKESRPYLLLANSQKIEYYYFHQLLFGSLLLSDKRDVILERNFEKPVLPDSIISDFKNKKGFTKANNELDSLKNQAYQEALAHLDTIFTPDNHLYSLTLPTGLGKTIASFGIALEIKKRLKLPNQRLIITIPFTSIIDQNFEVYKEILDSESSDILLKHHHLSEPIYKLQDDELNPDKSSFLIETWQSEVVVTTFVQLFNSIFSNDKSLLMKMPNLANSIIILDEIQTIPYCYWQLINETFKTLGKTYNCYFITMSATQPLIFLPEKEITEIIPNYEFYFKQFNRTRIINHSNSKISLDDFTCIVEDYLSANLEKDVLLILNTKKHSKKIFEVIRSFIDTDTNELYYLSTLITPFERKTIINLIKKPSTKRKIIVSTQLIEAGVDLSVDTVFRILAPIDAIIQAAGRANRYNEKNEQGEVYLYDVEEMSRATNLVYGSDLIKKTQNVLKNIDTIEESAYLELIKNYFEEVKNQSDSYHSKFLKSMINLDFKDVGEFSLIEERETKSVFLQLNQQAKAVWEEYHTIYQNPILKSYQKKQLFANIKSVFYDFVINVPLSKGQKEISFDREEIYNFHLSTLENPSAFYKYDKLDFTQNTGYQELDTLSL
jgi:CRISPR-associated endonuclease/helicase Cas3